MGPQSIVKERRRRKKQSGAWMGFGAGGVFLVVLLVIRILRIILQANTD